MRGSQKNKEHQAEMANVLNDYLASAFTDEDDGPLPAEEQMDHRTTMQDIQITAENIGKKIKSAQRRCARTR